MGFSKYACSCLSLLLIKSVEEGSCWLRPAVRTSVLRCACILGIPTVCLEQAATSYVVVRCGVVADGAAKVSRAEGCHLPVFLKLKL